MKMINNTRRTSIKGVTLMCGLLSIEVVSDIEAGSLYSEMDMPLDT
jgi:hypothetical protein